MAQPERGPLYLLDENLPPAFAPVFSAIGFKMTSVSQAFLERRSVPDEEIIAWLGVNEDEARYSVWVTTDHRARRMHGPRIMQAGISVLWIERPPRKGLTSLQELQLLSLILNDVQTIVASSSQPVYLLASLVGRRAKLQQVVGGLMARRLELQSIKLS